MRCCPVHNSIIKVYNRSEELTIKTSFYYVVVRNTDGRFVPSPCVPGTNEAIVGEEMGISLNKLYIWNQQTIWNPMLVFLSPFYCFFEKCQFFFLHFHYDNFLILETFWLRNVRSGHGDRFPKKKWESDKRKEIYERILQTVSTIFEDTLIIIE